MDAVKSRRMARIASPPYEYHYTWLGFRFWVFGFRGLAYAEAHSSALAFTAKIDLSDGLCRVLGDDKTGSHCCGPGISRSSGLGSIVRECLQRGKGRLQSAPTGHLAFCRSSGLEAVSRRRGGVVGHSHQRSSSRSGRSGKLVWDHRTWRRRFSRRVTTAGQVLRCPGHGPMPRVPLGREDRTGVLFLSRTCPKGLREGTGPSPTGNEPYQSAYTMGAWHNHTSLGGAHPSSISACSASSGAMSGATSSLPVIAARSVGPSSMTKPATYMSILVLVASLLSPSFTLAETGVTISGSLQKRFDDGDIVRRRIIDCTR
jgi:hypothetical protein